MSVLTIRAKIKPERVEQVEAFAGEMFAAIEGARPLSTLPEFREFHDNVKSWVAEPPVREPLTVVGSYRLI